MTRSGTFECYNALLVDTLHSLRLRPFLVLTGKQRNNWQLCNTLKWNLKIASLLSMPLFFAYLWDACLSIKMIHCWVKPWALFLSGLLFSRKLITHDHPRSCCQAKNVKNTKLKTAWQPVWFVLGIETITLLLPSLCFSNCDAQERVRKVCVYVCLSMVAM